jgi:DNA-binding response OmpR family regulator
MAKTILVVDDDENIVTVVRANLERAGYKVTSAADGTRALNSIAADPPDLLILDIMMPGMSGFEVARALRSDVATRDIPIIMLTARSSDTDIADAWHVGIDTYLAKPFAPAELMAFVSRFLP